MMAVLSPELRKAAYVERKAAEAERKELEEVGEALEYAVLFAPQGYPLKSYMPLLRESFLRSHALYHGPRYGPCS